ncbi:hypothetical protein HN51_047314 [Arachis hypogaea]|uniref:uncharacterized protein LOC107625210 isoform X1 n=1 Tax=Arachis ipaensis TaxID=130454 RepID=UPI0007AF5A83|nr:uncharacterized protein LOC107625210 isoform X1 [Arachis ipaensis]XP_025632746.1 uncharacterized protein LOC112727281 isoform X1 [Arachis hypogaea]
MEKSRHRRSPVASRNQPHTLVLPQGSKQVHRQRQFPDLSPDSVSCGGGVADKDSFSFKFGWRSSKQLFGTPIKKLLADEMSQETESKRRNPGVIARLMGLDGLPANKQQKGSSENPVEKVRNRGTSYDGRSSRRSSKDQQEFKDVFEVSEIPMVESSRYSSHVSAKDLRNANEEMSFIEQKFMDAKRLATYQDLQSSRDFHDTLEVLDSNKELLLKYFKRPDSLFKKHLSDLQADPFESHLGHTEAMQLPEIEKYGNEFDWRLDTDTALLSYDKSHQRQHDGYPRQFNRRHVMHSSPRSSKLQSKGKHEQGASPTKIVVLKPNLGKSQSAARNVSSPCSPHIFQSEHANDTEFSDIRYRDSKMYPQKINLPDTARPLRHNSLESREIAKEITRQMKNSLNNGGCVMLPSSGLRGYAGDDSSCSVSGNESTEESVGTPATWGNSSDLNNCSRRSSHSGESSVSREAKKRLSERWKMAHKSQEIQIISKSSTLAEMLAITDKDVKTTNFDGRFTEERHRNKPAGWVEPLGISSRDGWKDGCIGSLPRSRSLPASSNVFGSPRTIMRNEVLRDDRFRMPKEAIRRERRRGRSHDQRHGVNSRSTRSGHKKSWSMLSSELEGNEFSPSFSAIENKMEINLEEGSPKLDVPTTESLAVTLKDTSVLPDTIVSVANEDADRSCEPSDKVLPETSLVLIKGDNRVADKDNSIQQELSAGSSDGTSDCFQPPAPGLESSCGKDTDQPSPVSVLEPSFTDDLSSSCSECFESLSADLQGLRMQLQLLKLESEGYAEGSVLISSDEECGEGSTRLSEDNRLCRTEDSWESSYIIDVLSESGIDGAQPDPNFEFWHSLESPVSLSVFNELEKRYCDWTTCSRSERRLLFDRINSGIVKIHNQSMNLQPWVSRATTNVGSKLIENRIQDGLFRLLGSQGKVKDDALGKVLVKEPQWLDLGDEIDVIGREIERLLLEELVAEIAGA